MLGAPAMKLLSVAFPEVKIVAVGNNARDLIKSMGIRTAGTVRHPARGGATPSSPVWRNWREANRC